MKQIFIFLLLLFCSTSLISQTPDKISFQAIVRNNANELIKNSSIGIKLSVIKNTIDGTVIYAETHKPTTNDNGLINLEIGNGTKLIGDFTTIDWSSGKFFTKTEIDITGGSNYSISSVNQLLSVPYALYAKNAGSVSGLSKSTVGLSNVDNTSDIEKPVSNQTKTFVEDALLNKNVWLNGTTSPVNSLGEINNFYINTSNGDYYKKTGANSWTLLGNLTGPQGPAGQIGANGQAGQTGAQGAQGLQGLQGVQGIQGVAGNNGPLWLNGTSVPNNSAGAINDFYINTLTGDYYKKTGASTWTLQANLTGPAGQTGAQGLQGTQGIQGIAGSNGSVWSSGTSVPNNSDGAINDFYINTATGNYYKKTGASTWTLQANLTGPAGQTGAQGAQGLQGLQGIQGIQGVGGNNGSLWLSGTSTPSNSDGAINDFYVNTTTSDYYKKTGASTWTLQANLTGPAGQTGAQGLQGIQGVQGTQGIAGNNGSVWSSGTSVPNNSDGSINDFYINTSNGNYYKKTGASTWTLQANLTGPVGQTGAQGLQGIQGIQGIQGSQGTQGVQGTAGTNGSTWLSGSSIPNNSDGVVNDFYINTTNGNYYKKTGATTWTLQANLTGPQGPASSSTTPVYNNRFTSTGSYTVPSGVHTLFLEFTGTKGGAGADLNYFYQPSGGCSQPYITRSGGAGGKAYKIKSVVLVNPGDVISFTLGTNGVQPSIENTPCYGSAYYVSPYTASNGTNGATSQLFINSNSVVSIFGGERGFGAYNNQGQVQAYNGAASTVNGSAEYSNNIDSFSFMITSENISNDSGPSVLIKH
jgi:hypothetical protein